MNNAKVKTDLKLEKMEFNEIIVRFADADPAGIMYFANYPTYFDESFIKEMRKQGSIWSDRETHDYLIPIVEQKVNYYKPLRPGDITRTYFGITELREKVFRTEFLLTKMEGHNQIPMASGYITRVCVGFRSFKSRSLPDKLRTILQNHMVDQDNWAKMIDELKNNKKHS